MKKITLFALCMLLIPKNSLGMDSHLEVRNNKSYRDLLEAYEKTNFDEVKQLIDGGILSKVPHEFAHMLLLGACLDGHVEIARLLIEKGISVRTRYDNSNSLLHAACVNGRPDVVRLLIEKGAQIDVQNNNGDTPLHLACSAGHENIVRLLLQQGASVNARDNQGALPLYVACLDNHVEIARALIQKGASVNARETRYNETCLHVACQKNNLEIAKLLIDNKALIDVRDGLGTTPLHYVVWKVGYKGGYNELVKLLLDAHARIDKKTPSGNQHWTPIHQYAASNYPDTNKDIGKLLMYRSFLSPCWQISNNNTASLKEQCFVVLLKNLKNYEVLKSNRLRLEDWSADFIADKVPLYLQQELVKAWQDHASFKQIESLLRAHCKRHLRYIKQALALQDSSGSKRTARDISQVSNKPDLVRFFDSISRADKFIDLNEEAQQAIVHNIKGKLGIAS